MSPMKKFFVIVFSVLMLNLSTHCTRRICPAYSKTTRTKLVPVECQIAVREVQIYQTLQDKQSSLNLPMFILDPSARA